MAYRTDGSLWSWGDNSNGQLGDGTRNGRNLPSAVPGLLIGVTGIAAGDKHSLAIVNGSLYAWGWNQYGQLGDGTLTDRLSPVVVPNTSGISNVAAGARHSLALFSNSTIQLWGDNFYGQLGNRSGNYNPLALAEDQLSGDGQVVCTTSSDTSSSGLVEGRNNIPVNSDVDYINFGAQKLGVANPKQVQITNSYLTPWSNFSIQVSGNGYTQTNNCPATLSAGSSCTVTASFTPSNLAQVNGAITIQGDRGKGSETLKTLSLSGIGSPTSGTASQTIGVISFSPNTLVVGGTTTVNATTTSGLAVSFSTTTQAVCTVSGNTVTGVSLGACTIVADQAGYATFTAAPQVTQNITISKLATAITWGTPAAITYGTTLSTTQLNATANVAGTFAYTPALGTIPGAGTQQLSVTFTPTDTTNYSSQVATVNLTVNKATLTITANNASRAYGAANPASPGFTASALVSGDVISGVTYTYATGANSSAGVGTSYTITPSVAVFSSGNAANYTISYLAGTLTISNPVLATYTVSTNAGANGSISPISQSVTQGNATSFTLTPVTGYAASATGCSGSLNGNTFTTGIITADCTVSATFTQTVNLAAGWNLLGNSIDAPMDVTAILNDTTKVTTVWKWIPSSSKWAFYTPSMIATDLANYATGKGYEVLTTISGGEGFWVNAKAVWSIQLPLGTAISSSLFADQQSLNNKLPKGWSLIAVGDSPIPRIFANTIALTQPVSPDIAANSLTTLWSWDNGLSRWYFYAPSLDNSGALTSYITSKGYLNFSTNSKTLDPTMGFWVNHP
jgi:hypothetical protein